MNFEISKWGDHKIVWIDSTHVDRCIEIYRKQRLDGVGVSPHKGFRSGKLDFLAEIPDVGGVVLSYADHIDISGLPAAARARFLSISGNKQAMDYDAFPGLEELRLEWHKKLSLPQRHHGLRWLYLRGYKPAVASLKDLPDYPRLSRLELVQGNVSNLDGIQRFIELRSAEFSYMTRLEDVGPLTRASKLESLLFEVCRKVHNFEAVAKLHNLKSLCIHDCGTIPSIRFIAAMRNLQSFRFVKTNVEDGDMTACLKLREVAFTASRHYSHTPDEVRAAIAARKV